MPNIQSTRGSKKSFLSAYPYCCFCGGDTQATTIDHVPSIQLFSLRQRPAGLEFPACRKCNEATRIDELVVAWLARTYPDPTTEKERAEVRKLLKKIKRRRPLLLSELEPSWRQQYDFAKTEFRKDRIGGILNASGHLLNESVRKFGTKLGLALHYEHTTNIVPSDGGVWIRWFSNYDRATNNIPDDIFKIFSASGRHSLAAGRWTVEDQFSYAFAVADTQQMSAFFATFRLSFAIAMFVATSTEYFSHCEGMPISRPGFERVEEVRS